VDGRRGAGSPDGRGSDGTEPDGSIDIRRYPPLSAAHQEFLLSLARMTLEGYVSTGAVPDAELPADLERALCDHRGVFVTLYSEGRLRGCVGCHHSELPLFQTIQKMVVSSGFQDPRFPPLRRQELESLRIEISAYLTGVVPIESPEQFEVGRHGIIMTLGGRTSTFLPKVASQQGWNREQTMERLCRKAGLTHDAWKSSEARFSVYETQVFHE